MKSLKHCSFIVLILSLSLLFTGIPCYAFNTCPGNSPDGVHHFSGHRSLNYGYTVTIGYHSYLYGYDANNQPIIRNDCLMSQAYHYCEYYCVYCGIPKGDGVHTEEDNIIHSVLH